MQELTIEELGYNGEGVSHVNGKVCFVKYVLPNEVVKAKIIKSNSKYCWALPEKIIKSSPDRIMPLCSYFEKCGGCDFQHIKYEKEIEIKKQILEKQLDKIGIKNLKVNSIFANDYFYRNKIRLYPTDLGLGYHGIEGMVSIENCKLATQIIDKNIRQISEFIFENKSILGLIYVELRCFDDLICINFFVKKKVDFDFKSLAERLSNKCQIYLTVNGKSFCCYSNSLNGEKVNPCAFKQVNNKIAEKLYKKVITYAQNKSVANCYSGAGLLSKLLIDNGALNVYGLELGENEHQEAEELKRENNLKNLINMKGDCADLLPKISRDIDLIIVDPPRGGCSQSVIQSILDSKAKNLIYISCNNATFARDISYLKDFKIIEIELYDMFPRTANFEIFAYLIRK